MKLWSQNPRMFSALTGIAFIAGCSNESKQLAKPQTAPTQQASADAAAEAGASAPENTNTPTTTASNGSDVSSSNAKGTANGSGSVAALSAKIDEMTALKDIPQGAAQLAALCARPGKDKVRTVFCAPTPPTIAGLVDLQKALGLNFTNATPTGTNNNNTKQGNGNQGNPAFALTGHSSSLVGRFTSAINPRAIIFSDTGVGQANGNPDPNFVAMGFVRGEQFAEVIAQDPATSVPAFFLVRFEQACNSQPSGCPVGQLLTPDVEKNWTKVTIYEDTDLANTVFDCLQCHQTGGPGTPKSARMQERRNPWTHFFRDDRPGGQALIADFKAAHGTAETYAGIPPAVIASSDPLRLERLIENNRFDQPNIPNEFQTGKIEGEVTGANKAQPQDNTTPGVSATWQTLFTSFVTGKVIAPPYHDVKVTDPVKLKAMTAAYQGFVKGTTPPAELPDIREVLLTSRAYEMGFAVEQGKDGNAILINACAQCHNNSLNQNLSRAKFNVDLTKMSADEKAEAVKRINLPANDPKRMPPARFRDLSAADIQSLTDLLKK